MKRVLLVFALVLVMMLAVLPVAGAHTPVCGKDFGMLHKTLAQGEGPMGQSHKPGKAHNGAAGLCLLKDVPHWNPTHP